MDSFVSPAHLIQQNGKQSRNLSDQSHNGLRNKESIYLYGMSNGESDDIEAARLQLEQMLGGLDTTSSEADSKKYPYPLLSPKLLNTQKQSEPTEEQRKMLAKEIQILSSLFQSDGVEGESSLTELWTHWFAERGPESASLLLQAEQLSNMDDEYNDEGINPYHEEAELQFRKIIDEHGVYWAEPINRLATLLYKQGRLEESKACCELVLAVKPWHFGALSGIVMVCIGMKDYVNAKIWADRRLPPLQPVATTQRSSSSRGEILGGNERRKEWIKRAVKDATDRLFYKEYNDDGDDVEDFDEESFLIQKDILEHTVIDGIYNDDSDDSWQ